MGEDGYLAPARVSRLLERTIHVRSCIASESGDGQYAVIRTCKSDGRNRRGLQGLWPRVIFYPVHRRMHRDLQIHIPMCCLPNQATANEESDVSGIVLQNKSEERAKESLTFSCTSWGECSADDAENPDAKRGSLVSPESWMETGPSRWRRRWRALSLRGVKLVCPL